MPVKRCILKGKSIRSLDELYDELAKSLPFPAYFGRNLDALYDVLSTEIAGPFQISWEDAEASKKAMGADFEKIAALFRDLMRERPDFRISYS